ncbi:MAG: membrane-bound lytic murein transglycosylase MltF [Desulfobacterales bacterium]|nr:membrane-bound lytic murein transglycosylase MltF [Desulfobacterales bacterium]
MADNRINNAPKFIVNTAVIFLFLSCCLFFIYVNSEPDELNNILKTGNITVITRNNSHCYYLYRGQAMGFEYELAKLFADYLGVKLEIIIAEQWDEMIPALKNGTASFVAASMTITPKRQKEAAFSNGYISTRQYVIVRRNNTGIKKIEDLAGKTVHVRKGTSYQERLEALRRDGIDVKIKLHDNIPTDELMQQVAEGAIKVTIADRNIALLNRRYYPQIALALAISNEEDLGWAVKPSETRLLNKINLFFKKIKGNGKLTEIYNKYYADIDNFDYVDLRRYHIRLKTRLPRYSRLIKDVASRYGFDWRLIAAQIYQESHFNPAARSSSGAFGLMQLTGPTADSLGVNDVFDPVQNINAGIRHLKNLYDHFDWADSSDRLFIALAAYNIGQGHIQDARNLAKQMNFDPDKWSSLEKTLPLLRYRKCYKKAKYGYCRGIEPINYIKQIMLYYDILKRRSLEFTTDEKAYQNLRPLKNVSRLQRDSSTRKASGALAG